MLGFCVLEICRNSTKKWPHHSQWGGTGRWRHATIVESIMTQTLSKATSLQLVRNLSRKRWLQLRPLWAHLLILGLNVVLAVLALILYHAITHRNKQTVRCDIHAINVSFIYYSRKGTDGPTMLTIWEQGSPFFFMALQVPKSWASPISSTFCGWSTVKLTCTITQKIL